MPQVQGTPCVVTDVGPTPLDLGRGMRGLERLQSVQWLWRAACTASPQLKDCPAIARH